MGDTSMTPVSITTALKSTHAVIGRLILTVICVWTLIGHSCPAVRAENHAGQTVRVFSIRQSFRPAHKQLVCLIPCLLINNRLVCILKEEKLFIRRFPSFLGLKVFRDCLAKHRVSQIFLAFQNVFNTCSSPLIGIKVVVIVAV